MNTEHVECSVNSRNTLFRSHAKQPCIVLLSRTTKSLNFSGASHITVQLLETKLLSLSAIHITQCSSKAEVVETLKQRIEYLKKVIDRTKKGTQGEYLRMVQLSLVFRRFNFVLD